MRTREEIQDAYLYVLERIANLQPYRSESYDPAKSFDLTVRLEGIRRTLHWVLGMEEKIDE